MTTLIHTGDVVRWAREYRKSKEFRPFHATINDPPYHLTSITKRFGKSGSKAPRSGTPYNRASKGFMAAKWDGGDVAFQPETWEAIASVLYPGAFGMSFAGSRGYHRMACAIEDAGMIIHPQMAWVFMCLSEDTEILTKDGWQHYSKAIKGTDVLCYDMEQDGLEWHPVQELHIYDHSDTAYSIRSDHTDQIVTRGHRCIVERGGKYVFKKAETLQLQESVPVLDGLQELRKPIQCREQRSVSQEELLLEGVFTPTDRQGKYRQGYSGHNRSEDDTHNMSSLWQGDMETRRMAEEGNQDSDMLEQMQTYHAIENIYRSAKDWPKTTEEETWMGNVWEEESCLEGRSDLLQKARQLQGSTIRQMSNQVHGNGSIGWICYGTSTLRGTTDRQTTRASGGSTPQRSQSSQQRSVQPGVVRKQHRSQAVRASRIASSSLADVTPIYYNGKVWCVTVPTGAFVVRRNGKIFITGNSGFPKSTRPDIQIDAAAGLKVDKGRAFNYKGNVIYGKYAERTDVRYVAQTDMAKAWAGHRYGLQALKPAFEPICLWQVPFPGQMKPFESMVKTGAGCLNIDDTWIDGPEGYVQHNPVGQNGVFNASGGTIVNEGGRWPSHLILDESYVSWSEWANLDNGQGPNHENFYITDWMSEVLEDEDPLIYSAKASVAEREAGLDAMQRRMMNSGEDDVAFLEGSINDGRMAESDRPYLRNQTIRRNIHATIKPISLTRYLAKMLLPPDIYGEMEGGRRLFVPFAGVGSEMCGAQLAGWEHIEGVELEENHAFLAKIRTDYWLQHAGKLDFRVKKVSVPDGQQTLF